MGFILRTGAIWRKILFRTGLLCVFSPGSCLICDSCQPGSWKGRRVMWLCQFSGCGEWCDCVSGYGELFHLLCSFVVSVVSLWPCNHRAFHVNCLQEERSTLHTFMCKLVWLISGCEKSVFSCVISSIYILMCNWFGRWSWSSRWGFGGGEGEKEKEKSVCVCVREEMCVKCFMKKMAVHYLEDLCFVVCICFWCCFGGLFFGCILLFYIYLDVTRGKGGENVLCLDIITVIKHGIGKCGCLCQMSEAISV